MIQSTWVRLAILVHETSDLFNLSKLAPSVSAIHDVREATATANNNLKDMYATAHLHDRAILGSEEIILLNRG